MNVLITCFGPYDQFDRNASQLAMELAKAAYVDADLRGELRGDLQVEWLTLPVDFEAAPEILASYLDRHPDVILHVGQAPGASALRIETRGVNRRQGPHEPLPSALVDGGAREHDSDLPLSQWLDLLVRRGLPAHLSNDAGDYLCNAVLYHSLNFAAKSKLPGNATFLHVPLTPEQTTPQYHLASLPAEDSAAAIHCFLHWITASRNTHLD
ncbi:MAG: hypothetical protein KDB14_21510 [Planctomycetales bacterium]|nr:hypothetical protein [Planctomycetales bacterium]